MVIVNEESSGWTISGILSGLATVVYCSKLCTAVGAWCERCLSGEDDERQRRISKKDIQPLVLHQPVVSALDLSSIRYNEDSGYLRQSSAGLMSASVGHSPIRLRFSSTESSPHFLEAEPHSFSSSSRKSSITSSVTAESRYRPPQSPAPLLIDMKPIEFWACTTRESVQPPRSPRNRRRLVSESEASVQGIRISLYGEGAAAATASPDAFSEELPSINEGASSAGPEESRASIETSSSAGQQLGRVHIGVQYDINAACLYVRLIEARDLPSPNSRDEAAGVSGGNRGRGDVTRSNSYARVRLLPDGKVSYQTSVQRKTQNPIWEEQFAFAVPFVEVQDKSVEVVVKDFDKYSRHYLIGCTTIPLDSFNVLKGTHLWRALEPCAKCPNELGEIQLALNFLPAAGRLNVDVISAKQLLQTDLLGRSDPFVKVALFIGDKLHKTRRTSTVCHTIDPIFNESLSFNVSADQIDDCTIIVTVWGHNSKSRDELIGRILLGRQSSGAEETSHWLRLLKGGCYRSPSAQWHVLRSKEDCDSMCPLSLVA